MESVSTVIPSLSCNAEGYLERAGFAGRVRGGVGYATDIWTVRSKVVAPDNPVRFGAAARTSDLSETSSCGATDGGDALTAESKCPGQVRTRNNVEGPPVRIVHQETVLPSIS